MLSPILYLLAKEEDEKNTFINETASGLEVIKTLKLSEVPIRPLELGPGDIWNQIWSPGDLRKRPDTRPKCVVIMNQTKRWQLGPSLAPKKVPLAHKYKFSRVGADIKRKNKSVMMLKERPAVRLKDCNWRCLHQLHTPTIRLSPMY